SVASPRLGPVDIFRRKPGDAVDICQIARVVDVRDAYGPCLGTVTLPQVVARGGVGNFRSRREVQRAADVRQVFDAFTGGRDAHGTGRGPVALPDFGMSRQAVDEVCRAVDITEVRRGRTNFGELSHSCGRSVGVPHHPELLVGRTF